VGCEDVASAHVAVQDARVMIDVVLCPNHEPYVRDGLRRGASGVAVHHVFLARARVEVIPPRADA
jgi:hypothetical protein